MFFSIAAESDNIKCTNCDVVKPRPAFSDTQLSKRTGQICIECSPKRLEELECDWCEEWKAITDFSSGQRKMDNPTCKKCVEEKMTM